MAVVASIAILSGEVVAGTGLLIGSIPAAIIGLTPKRQDRTRVLIVGLAFSLSLLLGSIFALWVPLAVVGMFLLGWRSTLIAVNKPLGLLALGVCLPLAGFGLTYSGVKESATVVLLMALGSVGSYLWSMLFPSFSGTSPKNELVNKDVARRYSVLLGLAAAVSTATGFLLGVDFVGWLVGSTLLVIRPGAEMTKARGIGRTLSVLVGASIASWLLTINLSLGAIALVSGLALVMMAATSASRWYVTPAFTSFLILWALLYGQNTHAEIANKYNERILDTIIGVGIAYAFGALIPAFIARRNRRSR